MTPCARPSPPTQTGRPGERSGDSGGDPAPSLVRGPDLPRVRLIRRRPKPHEVGTPAARAPTARADKWPCGAPRAARAWLIRALILNYGEMKP